MLPRLFLISIFLLHPLAAEKKADTGEAKGSATVEKTGLFNVRGFSLGVGANYSRFRYYPPFGYYRPYSYSWGGSYYWGRYPFHHLTGAWAYPDFYHPAHFAGSGRTAGGGRIKLKTKFKEASVYLDGAFAGLAKDLKDIWLKPGVYQLKLETDRHQPFEIRVYVLTGKTVRIEPNFEERSQE